MIDPIEDRFGNFVRVKHTASGHDFLLHQSLVDKVGLNTKVQVYEYPKGFLAPSGKYPKGKYVSKVKFFIAAFLTLA